MTTDYSVFKMDSSPMWALQPTSPEVFNKACSGDPNNIIRRMSDVFGIDASNWGIFPAAQIRNSDTDALYYESYSYLPAGSGMVYEDFYVLDNGDGTLTVYWGLAYDKLGRRIAVTSSATFSAANPTAVDSWGYSKPKSTGNASIPVAASGAGTYKLYIEYLPVVEDYSSPKTSVNPVSPGDVRYTRIVDGYKIGWTSGALSATQILLATVTVSGGGAYTIDQTTGRTYLRVPGGLISAPVDTGTTGILPKTVAEHLQAIGTDTADYSSVNPHRQKLHDLGGWEEIEQSLAGYFRVAFGAGLIDSTYANAFRITGTGANITFTNLAAGAYAFVNGYLFNCNEVYEAAGSSPLSPGYLIPYTLTAPATYYVYLEEDNLTDGTHRVRFTVSTSPGPADSLPLYALAWNGAAFTTTDSRKYNIVDDDSRQASTDIGAGSAVVQAKKISSLEVTGSSTIPAIAGNVSMSSGTLTLVSGDVALTAGDITLTAGGITAAAGIISGLTLISTGNTTVGGDLVVTGNATIPTIPGSVVIGTNLTVGGDLVVTGTLSASGSLSIGSLSTAAGIIAGTTIAAGDSITGVGGTYRDGAFQTVSSGDLIGMSLSAGAGNERYDIGVIYSAGRYFTIADVSNLSSIKYRFKIDTTGIVSTPYQSGCRVHMSGSLGGSGERVVPYNTEDFDIQSEWNNSSYIFTAANAGVYSVYASVLGAGGNGTYELRMYVNGVLYSKGWATYTDSQHAKLSDLVELAVGGTIQFKWTGTSDPSITTNTYTNYATIAKVA